MPSRLSVVRSLLNAVLDRRDREQVAGASKKAEHGELAMTSPLRAEYCNIATPEDIFYCFRLLLGRNPNPEEWPGHSSRAGEDLQTVVSSYVTSREFATRGLLNKTYRDELQLVQFPRFSIFASNDDLAVGHHVIGGRPYEPGI